MDMRKEYRKLLLVPLVDGQAVIEYAPEEWIDSVSEFNDQFLRVVIAGLVLEEPVEDEPSA